jgi:hypothetical protein
MRIGPRRQPAYLPHGAFLLLNTFQGSNMQRRPICAFLTANAISLTGNNLTMIAAPWFVLETTGSAAYFS